MHLIENAGLQPGGSIHVLVEPGSKNEAIAYYGRIKTLIGFDPITSDLSSVIAYLGYSSLGADTVETADPVQLMAQHPNGEILATRFFAPKIVDFNTRSSNANPYVAGWRRLVRVKAAANSPASNAGIKAAYVLFNYTQPDPETDPFVAESKQNQVILVRDSFKPEIDDAAFYLVYGPRSAGYQVGYSLIAAFDLPSTPGTPTQEYFLPTACAQCHGHDEEYGAPISSGTFAFAKLNYLDSDQWYDMAKFDFPATVGSNRFDVLFDGGKDQALPAYSAAVDVLRKLNEEIKQQNSASSRPTGTDLFKTASVEKWLSVHSASSAPAPSKDRALFVGAVAWDPSDADEQHLLGLLNRNCFRCHGSMYYSIFDKAAVLDRRSRIARYVASGFMPQGRQLDPVERAEIVDYLNRVK